MDDGERNRLLYLQIVVSVSAVVLLVVHLVRPALKIDGAALGLLAVALVPWLGPLFSSIQMPGGWKFEFRELHKEVTRGLAENAERVNSLTQRVDALAVAFSGAVTPDLKRRLEDELGRYHAYLADRGLELPTAVPSVNVSPDLIERTQMVSSYDATRNAIDLDGRYADDPDLILREYTHQVLLAMLGGQAADWTWAVKTGRVAVQSGLAFYLPCSFHDRPLFGQIAAAHGGPFGPAVSLANEDRLDLGVPDQWWVEDRVWGAVCWGVRELIGAETGDQVLTGAWRQGNGADDGDFRSAFARAVIAAVAGVGGEGPASRAADLLERRGLPVRNPTRAEGA